MASAPSSSSPATKQSAPTQPARTAWCLCWTLAADCRDNRSNHAVCNRPERFCSREAAYAMSRPANMCAELFHPEKGLTSSCRSYVARPRNRATIQDARRAIRILGNTRTPPPCILHGDARRLLEFDAAGNIRNPSPCQAYCWLFLAWTPRVRRGMSVCRGRAVSRRTTIDVASCSNAHT